MEDLKVGNRVRLNSDESNLIRNLDMALRFTVMAYIDENREALACIAGGGDNAVMTAIGKMFCDIVVVGAIHSGTPIDKVKKYLLKLVSEEVDECYQYHKDEVMQ